MKAAPERTYRRSSQRLINYSTAMSWKGTSFSRATSTSATYSTRRLSWPDGCCDSLNVSSSEADSRNRTSENLKNRLRNLISEIFPCFADRDEWIFSTQLLAAWAEGLRLKTWKWHYDLREEDGEQRSVPQHDGFSGSWMPTTLLVKTWCGEKLVSV